VIEREKRMEKERQRERGNEHCNDDDATATPPQLLAEVSYKMKVSWG